jgi:hypothetical protein
MVPQILLGLQDNGHFIMLDADILTLSCTRTTHTPPNYPQHICQNRTHIPNLDVERLEKLVELMEDLVSYGGRRDITHWLSNQT